MRHHEFLNRPGWVLVALLGICLLATSARAECSDGEITATFLVDFHDYAVPQITVLDAVPLGPVTNPSVAEMIEAIEAVQPGYSYSLVETVGPFNQFWAEPMDFGACAIVDGRDGRVVFAGTVIWSGVGTVSLPQGSSHGWTDNFNIAQLPTNVAVMSSPMWWDGYGVPAEITAMVIDRLLVTDVVQSFFECGDYTVTSYIYTPRVGLLDPDAAQLVTMVSGHCGPPWNGEPVATAPSTWSQVRALFH